MTSLPLFSKAQSPNPRSRSRILVYLAAFLLFSWTAYLAMFRSSEAPSVTTTDADLESPSLPGDNIYGTNARPDFKDMIKLRDLPEKFVPETGKHRSPGRLVVVGDVHGMLSELVMLLDKVQFDKKHDHLIFAGDMISKGPDSPGVVDLAMKLGATGVRGNHEDRIILAHKDMLANHLEFDDLPSPHEDREKTQDMLEELSFSHGDYKDRRLVKQLGEKRIKWLKELPVILRIGELGDLGEVVVVHAGLAPGVRLEKQDPSMVMNMRTIGDDGVPSEEREGKGWMKAWNKYQKSQHKKNRSTVIYGHDSKRGLQIGSYSMGVDTSCLKGGQLTAVVIQGGSSSHKTKLVHVNCKDGREKNN